jgi:hypothetical protein
MSILQLTPSLPVFVVDNPGGFPTGTGLAIFLIDESREHHTLWAVALDDGGSVYWVPNPYVRLQANMSVGRRRERFGQGS